MNDAKFNYGFFALKNGAEIDKSISALPVSKTKKEKTSSSPPQHETDEENISALPVEEIVDEKEQKRNRVKSLIKLAIIGASIAIVIIISTIAWFTMNRETSAGGMGITTTTMPYVIEPLSGGNNIYQDYHDKVMSTDAIIWAMTSTDKINNNDENVDSGIKPGHSGMISFYVKPSKESVNLDLTFEIVGYSCTETNNAVTGNTDISMTRVADEYQRYLAGHIFLFAGRDDIKDPETDAVIGHTYSTPIVSGADLKKTLLNQNYTKANENTPVTIYWIWPQTLSTLIDARINSNVSIEPITSGTDRANIVTNIATYPSYYFYNYAASGVTLTEAIMAAEYDIYCDKYDSADNAIGTNVNYITLKMTTDESSEGE